MPKKDTHHCPMRSKGNCRRGYQDSNHLCIKHETLCTKHDKVVRHLIRQGCDWCQKNVGFEVLEQEPTKDETTEKKGKKDEEKKAKIAEGKIRYGKKR